MTEEKLQFANVLNEKVKKLDEEIYLLMDMMPSVRSFREVTKRRGWLQTIRGRSLIHKKKGHETEIELSNEDVRALVDIRTAEREALYSVLKELG